MKLNLSTLLIVILSIVIIYLIYDTYFVNEVEYVKSSIDNREYLVRKLKDKTDAANLLAKIRSNLDKIVYHLKETYPDKEATKNISANFKSDNISEGAEHAKYTSYSINKGEKIVLCIRSKDSKKELVDLNTMMFVALHELAHIATTSIGHTEEFWDNFKWILKEAIKMNIYKYQDFNSSPKGYCGIEITDNPLNH